MLNLLCNLYTTIDNFLCIFKGTVKEPACKDYVKVCLLSCILTFNNLFTKQSQPCILSPTKALLKEIFSGVVLNTLATVACRRRTMLNREGNWDFNVRLPSHMSSQNRICEPSLSKKCPKLRKLSFTPILLVQKYESPGFLLTCPRVLFFRYLFRNNSCQIPSSLHSLNNHLLSRHLF